MAGFLTSKTALLLGGVLAALLGCSNAAPLVQESPAPSTPPAAVPAPQAATVPVPEAPAPVVRPMWPVWPDGKPNNPQVHWVPAAWQDLPGWTQDNLSEVRVAWMRSCERIDLSLVKEWGAPCKALRQMAGADHNSFRAWVEKTFLPLRVQSQTGEAQGLLTGYYEPLVEASRTRQGAFIYPLYQAPKDLKLRKPYWTRQEVETLPQARASLVGRELAWVADPLDALILQIQGSGRLQFRHPNGLPVVMRLAYAGHNDHPYRSIGRWLVEQGELKAEQVSWPSIKAWAQLNPLRVQELLHQNPRLVFFELQALPDPQVGPQGSQGAALTPGRSIAVDRSSIPLGLPVWLDTTEPLSTIPMQRLVMAQDTGNAIVGAVRADYFWGWDAQSGEQAGRTRQALKMWVLWPQSDSTRLPK